jgi:cytochrome P450
VQFHALPPPTDEDVEQLTIRIVRRIARLLERTNLVRRVRNTFPVDATCKLFGIKPPRRDWWQRQAEDILN